MQKNLDWQSYLDYTKEIISSTNPAAPYDNPDYLHYTLMNEKRMQRWLKANPITDETAAIIRSISTAQHWLVITEPWCGDAAHIVPILYLMSTLNEKIDFRLQLRDQDSEIEQYLTNGTRSIPMLIVRNATGQDIFHWGPRPKEGQEMYLALAARKADFEEVKTAIQHYYNKDKSLSTQREVAALLQSYPGI
ncbi:thioredoxin family protein [Niabella terrae]